MVQVMACIALLLISLFSGASAAQEDKSLAENLLFLDIPVCVASMTSQKESEAPAVLTIITSEEIRNSGARDLNDILSLVPGFVPGEEVQNFQGYGVGGIWSLEGKMLVMIDGVQMNEILYGNPLFGASAFVDYIERIEIIRGPGSALYGGFGELAVINIISKNACAPRTTVSTMFGQMSGAYGHRSLNVNSSGSAGGVNVTVNAAVGDGHLSDRDFTDAAGGSYPMKDFGGENSWFADMSLDYKDLLLKFIGSSYDVQSVFLTNFDNTNNVYPPGVNSPLDTKFTTYALDAQYKIRLRDNFSISPRVTYTESDPWHSDNRDALLNGYYFYYPTRQVKLNATAEYDFDKNTDLILGGEYAADTAFSKGLSAPFADGSTEVDHNTQSVFGEFMAKTRIVNVTLGARYDNQSHCGGAFAPRLALTKAVGDFNFKALVSRAYRAPTILDIDYNPNIRPEFTNTIQAEARYLINGNMSAALSLFDTRIEDVIVYDASAVTYNNFGKTGTRGFDLSYQFRELWGYLNLSYSYYRVIDNEVPTYVAHDGDGSVNSDVLLGFPSSKASLSASYNVRENLSVNPTVLYLGQRYVSYWANAAGGNVNQALDPVTLVNINVRIKEAAKNLEIALGVYNIFDSAYAIAPGYYKVDQPTPSYSREYTVKLIYSY